MDEGLGVFIEPSGNYWEHLGAGLGYLICALEGSDFVACV